MPTASACVADVMEALQAGPGRDVSWEPSGKFTDPLELRSRYYFRVESGSRHDAGLGTVESLWEKEVQAAFLTDRISGQQAEELSRAVQAYACLRVMD